MHLDRLISVLETVAAAGRPVSAADVQRATDLPRPTCYRLLQTLAEHRLLDVTEGPALYSIGKRVQRLAVLGRSDADVATTVAPVLKETAIELGEAVFLSRFRDQRVEIVHVETPDDATRSFIHPGLGKRPLHACSCSKVIAAFADTDFQQSILEGPRRAYTEQTKTDAALIEREFADIRDSGFAECVEEIEIGVSSVAAPIRLGDGNILMSVGATGPIRRFTADRRQTVGRNLGRVANRIAASLTSTAL